MSSRRALKIVFVTNNYTPYSGGVVSSINSCAAALRECGHEVYIITLDFLKNKQEYGDEPYVIRISCFMRFMYKKNHMAIPWRADSQVKSILGNFKPDIIHVHHPFLLGQSARKAAKKLGIPVVFTYHTMYELYMHYMPIPLPQFVARPLVLALVNRFCKKIDGIVAPSTIIKQRLLDAGIQVPVERIPSSIQPIFINETEPLPEPTKNAVHLLVVSRFEPEKNLFLLVDVIKQVCKKDNRFFATFIGYGTEYERVKKYAYQKLSPEQIMFIHQPDHTIIAGYYRKADLFLFSSQTDTQGLVLAETMAGATPVIALDGPGQRDIITQGENGFIVHSPEEMAEKILLVGCDYGFLQQLKHAAWQTSSQYSPLVLVKKLIQFYEKLLS
jgi:1,2-diacylglycerol 3-alpha-glucosyltransferase